MFCSWCLVARFYDQFVSRGRYAHVLGAFIVLSVLQVRPQGGAEQQQVPV